MAIDLFGYVDNVKEDNTYSMNVNVPQYVPSGVVPSLTELVDDRKYRELVQSIRSSDMPDDVKHFLYLAATRHLVFNYAKVADYYAAAEPGIQKLMEDSALVIVDWDDAIANGYMRLGNKIDEIASKMDVTKRKMEKWS